MLSTEDFFAAFAAAGFLKSLVWAPSDRGETLTTNVRFHAPSEDVLGGQAFATNPAIEYPASALPGLKRGEEVTVNGVAYRLREDPRSELDGTRMRAPIERILR